MRSTEWRLFANQSGTSVANLFHDNTGVASAFGFQSESPGTRNNCHSNSSSSSLLSLFSPMSNEKVQSWWDIHVLLPSPNVGFEYRKGKNLEINIRVGSDPINNCDIWSNIKTAIRYTDRPERDLGRLLEVCVEHSGNERIREIIGFVRNLSADQFGELCIHIKKDSLEMPTGQELCQKVEALTLLHRNEVLARKVTISVQDLRIPATEFVSNQLHSITSNIQQSLERTNQDFFIGGYPEFLLKWYTMHIVPVHTEGPSVFKSSRELEEKENNNNNLFKNNASNCIVQ